MKESPNTKKQSGVKPPQPRNTPRVMVTLDQETIDRLTWIQTKVPESNSISAAIRWSARIAEASLKDRRGVAWKIQ